MNEMMRNVSRTNVRMPPLSWMRCAYGSLSLIYLAHLRRRPSSLMAEKAEGKCWCFWFFLFIYFARPLHIYLCTHLCTLVTRNRLGKRRTTINQIKPISRGRFPYAVPAIISVPRHPSNLAWVPSQESTNKKQIANGKGSGNGDADAAAG